MSQVRRIMLVGNGPYLNHGCEAIMRGTIAVISRKFGDDLEFVSATFADPAVLKKQDEDESDHRIRSIGIDKPRSLTTGFAAKALRKLRIRIPDRLGAMASFLPEASVALELGGDNYSLCYGLWVLRRYMCLDEYLWHHNLPVVLWGASVGPFSEDTELEAKMAQHLRRMSLVLVRETESLKYLSSIGVEDNVRLVADPAFVMEPEEPVLDDALRRYTDGSAVGVNLSPLVAQYRSGGKAGWAEVATEYVRLLLESDVERVLLVPHVMVPGHNDYEFMSKVVESLSAYADRVAILPPALKAAEYKWVISRLRAIVAARTHATIAGFSSGVPTLSIGYSVKSIGINKDIYGHTDWCLPVAESTPERLLRATAELLSREREVGRQLRAAGSLMRERAYAAADHLSGLIGQQRP